MIQRCFEILKNELANPDKMKEHMDWMHHYIEIQGGGDISHVAAGEALAACALSVLWLTEDATMLHRILTNPRDGQAGCEDFRYAFAHHALLLLLQAYEADELVLPNRHLSEMDKIQALSGLVQDLAYESGDLAEQLGLQTPDF